jgi:ferric-dicitrate binding protein FerR (iron transport regulator)
MNDNERVELNELISALIDGRATTTEHRRLEEMLAASDEARRFYVRSMAMSASLFEYAGEMQSERPEPVNVIRVFSWRRWVAPLAAAAVVLLGIWMSNVFFSTSGPVNAEEQPESVARLSGSKDCRWQGTAPAPGDELTRGRRLELEAGVAELTFDSGAQLTLVGPAVLDLHSAWEAELSRGTLKASVPPEAVGFRVTNSSVEVVDLGTEFSMTAEEGAAEVFVLKGAVEVHPRGTGGSETHGSVLREKQARRFAKAGDSDVRDGERKFQRYAAKIAVERLAHPLNYVRWSFDEGAGDIVGATSSSATDSQFQMAPMNSTVSRWVEGRWGKAIQLDGAPALLAKLSDAPSRGIRSVACWIQLPSEAALSASGPVLTLPLNRSMQAWAEFSWNSLPGEGVLGALRIRSGTGTTVGTTTLRDGKWHHVAAIFGQPAKGASKPHVKMYVDGRLEAFSVKSPGRRKPDKAPVGLEGTLWVGGRPGDSLGARMAIDELFIADRQMTPQEIRHLMWTNQIISPETVAAN